MEFNNGKEVIQCRESCWREVSGQRERRASEAALGGRKPALATA